MMEIQPRSASKTLTERWHDAPTETRITTVAIPAIVIIIVVVLLIATTGGNSSGGKSHASTSLSTSSTCLQFEDASNSQQNAIADKYGLAAINIDTQCGFEIATAIPENAGDAGSLGQAIQAAQETP